jgi:Lrp/AsnC family leucine-responsive transcriptional regulator
MSQRHHPLDATDAKLLMLLQVDAQRSSRSLAEALAISPSSVQRRIRTLRNAGVIERVTAIVRPQRVGQHLTLLINVWLQSEDVTAVEQFKRQMAASPEVMHCYHVTGDHTFMLIVCLPNMESFARFAERVFNANPSVRKFNTSVAITTVKSNGAVPVVLAASGQ